MKTSELKKIALAYCVVFSGIALTGCNTLGGAKEVPQEAGEAVESAADLETELSDQAVQTLRSLIDSVGEDLESGVEPKGEVAKYRNESVKFWLDYFVNRDKDRFQRYLQRGQKYKEVVQTTLEENGVPNELYFMAMIESGYSTSANSHASAVGIWQFISATGRRYGLHYDYYVDERRDPIMATEAAVKYLRDLYNAFLSWELSMAAYNAGELRILRAIMDGKTRDFWAMAMQKRLPKETRNYVPKFIAAALIGRNPEKYGFDDPAKDFEPYPSVLAVEVPSPLRIRDIAKVTGVDYQVLTELNPHLRRGMTPGNRKSYEIWVPETEAEQFKSSAEKFTGYVKKSVEVFEENADHHVHVVKAGDSLSEIASRYRVSIGSLKRINGLSSSRIFVGKKLRISAASYRRPAGGGISYVVRMGDNLGLIARRYNISVRDLKSANNLSRDIISVGQGLVIPSKQSLAGGKYRVRRGDTLEAVAKRHGMSISDLKNINSLNRDTIYVGEWLKVGQDI